jgi:protein involved in polysaccharide export with SLBB domain
MEGIALAGGARQHANLSKIKVLRKQNSSEQEYVLDLDSQGRTFMLEPGDRILVEEEGRISVLGEVNRADNYYLKKDTTLFDAIAMAAGAKPNANLSKIKVSRKDEAKEYIVDLEKSGKEFILKPGDAIFVKPYEKISVLGAVMRPGSYDFKPGLTAVDAVALGGGFNELANQNAVRVIRQAPGGKRKIFNVPVGDILRSGDKSKDLLLEEGDTVSVGESMF